MSGEKSENLPADEQQKMLQEFLELQKQDIAVKQKELESRKDEIQSHERIALATIEAQKQGEQQHGEIFKEVHKRRLNAVIAIFFLIAAVLITALWRDKDSVAIEIVKIGGAVALGYFAGINRGKAQTLEKQRREKDSD
ncbi:TPA: hypothetical protein ACLBGG_001016 [Neisseria meningitidis]